MRAIFSFLLLAGLSLAAAPAQAERRIALVIGNDAYTEVTPLERAVADARAYRDMLSAERGFDVVFAENADRATMVAKVGEFLGRVRRDDVAMVVYSGHGVQLDPNRGDTLYLLPTDIPSVDPGSGGASFFMDSNAINFARLSAEVEARGAALRLFVLDACRNNPFPALEGGRSIGLTRGLGNIRSSRGEFVFFAAAPGEVALDLLPGDDASANSVFTRVFLKHFRQGEYLEDVANDVQAEVLDLSRRAAITQEPYYTDGVAGKTCIDRECGVVEAAPAPSAGSDLEATYWRLCETRDRASYCRAYLETFPTGPHAPLAELLIAELERGGGAADGASNTRVVRIGPASQTAPENAPPVPPTGAIAPLATPDPVVAAPAPDPVVAAVEPTAPVPDAGGSNQSGAAPLARQDEAFLAWSRLEDSWDIRAIRDFRDRYPDAEQAGEAGRRIDFLRARHREAQSELNRLGYNAGPVDGDWGRRSASALSAFQGDQGLSRSGEVSEQTLYALKTAAPRVAAAPAAQPAPQPSAKSAAPAKADEGRKPAPAPAPEPKVAALPPADGGIPEGQTWRAKARTPNGTVLTATMTRSGNKLKLEVEFDHRDNRVYYPWLIDHYTKSCRQPADDEKFDCWFSGEVRQSRPDSPGARVRGTFPRLRLEAHNLIGTADLVFAPAN